MNKKEKIINLLKKYREVIMYLIIGGCTTLVNWIVYTILISFGVSMTVCNGIAWFFAVIFAFFTNKIIVFKSKSKESKTLIKEIITFFGSRILSGIIEIFLPEILFNAGFDMAIFGIEGAVAKLSVSIIIIVMNYVLSKFLVFGKKRRKKS